MVLFAETSSLLQDTPGRWGAAQSTKVIKKLRFQVALTRFRQKSVTPGARRRRWWP